MRSIGLSIGRQDTSKSVLRPEGWMQIVLGRSSPLSWCPLHRLHDNAQPSSTQSRRSPAYLRGGFFAIRLFVPAEPVSEFPSYHVRVIFLDVVIAWPHVVCLYILQIFGEIGRDFGATERPWLGIKHQLGEVLPS